MPTKLFKELAPAEIERVIRNLYGNSAVINECRLLAGGNMNTNYFIKTDREANGLVLRAAPPPEIKRCLFSFHADMMSAEPLFHKLLEENGVPTVKVVKYASENVDIGREYMITEYLPSITMNDPLLRQTDLSSVYKEVGQYMRKLHTITSDRFGWKRPGSDHSEFDTWPQFVLAYMTEVANSTEEYELFEREHIEFLRALFNNKIALFGGVETPNMIHKDLHEGNILLHQRDGQYTVSAIIDMGWVMFGDRKWEFLSRCMINQDYLNGYGEDMPQDAEFKEMSLLYKLLHGFFTAYLVMVEYGNEKWYEKEKSGVLALIQEMI